MATTTITGPPTPAPPRPGASAPGSGPDASPCPGSGDDVEAGRPRSPAPPLAAAWIAGPGGLVLRWVGPG